MPQPAFPPIEDLLVHAPFVRAVATAAVYGDADVDDVVQTTWLAAMEGPPRHGRSVRGWLAAVARNAARGRGRSEGRRRRRERQTPPTAELPSTADIVAKEEIRRRLLAAVLELDATSRDALLLRYYEDLPPRAVAARLGVPVETARTRIKRGLERLRHKLDADTDGDRRAWALLVAPLAKVGLPAGATAAASVVGLGLLGKAAAALVLIGAVAVTIHVAQRRQDPAAPAPVLDPTAQPGRAGPPAWADARLRAAGGGRPVVPGRARLRGEVVLDEGVTGVRVESLRVASMESLLRRDFGARIAGMLRILTFDGPPDRTTTAAKDGTFLLQGLATGMHLVRAVHPDGRVCVRPVVLPHEAELHLRIDLTQGEHVLRGRVRHADGHVPRVRVLLSAGGAKGASLPGIVPDGPAPVAVDEDGEFAFPDLHPGRYALAVVEEGRCVRLRYGVEVPRDTPIDVTLGATATRSGRVIDAESKAPIANAHVLYFSEDGGDAGMQLGAVTTDAAGRFDVPDLGAKLGFFASAPGYPGRQSAHRGDEDLVIRLDRGMAITGHVRTREGEAVVGVEVRAGPGKASGEPTGGLAITHSNRQGGYRVEDLAPGAVSVVAWGDGWMSESLLPEAGGEPLALEGTPGETIEADLVVVRAARVTGRVLDEEGSPVVGASIVLQGEGPPGPPGSSRRRSGGSPSGPRFAATDASGRFALDTVLPAESARVVARTASGLEATSEAFPLNAGEPRDVEIRIAAARAFQVLVVDEDGQAVRGARVFVRVKDGTRTTSRPVADAGGLTTTGSDGTLTVPSLPPSSFELIVQAPGFAKEESGPHDGHADDLEQIRVVLSRTLAIEGRLTAGASLPWERVRIKARALAGGRSHTVRAKAGGAFRLPDLAPGRYHLEVTFPHDGATWTGTVEAAAGATDVALRLDPVRAAEPARAAPQPALPRWSIEVLGSDGARVPRLGHRDYGRWPDRAPMYRGFGRGRGNPLTVAAQARQTEEVWVEIFVAEDDDGRPLPLGALLLTPDDLPSGGGAVTVRLPPEATVSGRLLDAQDQPVAGVVVEAYPRYEEEGLPVASYDPHAEARSRPDGSFRLRQLGAHDYELRVAAPGRFVRPEPVAVTAGDEGVEIRIRDAAQVTLQVVDADGRPCPKCYATLRLGYEADNNMSGHVAVQVTTDARGRARLTGLDPELAYRLDIRPPQDAAGALPLVVENWTPRDTEIELPRGHAIAGEVVDANGDPVPHALVMVLSEPPNGWTSHFGDEAGRFRIQRLAAGDVTLRVTHRGHVFPWGEDTQRVRAGDESLRLVARGGGTLKLRMREFSGDPGTIRRVQVTDLTDERRFQIPWGFDPQGELLLAGLDAARRYAIDVQHEERGFVRSDLAPGQAPIDVRLTAGLRLVVRLDVPGGLPSDRQWQEAQVTAEGRGWRRHGRIQAEGTGSFLITAIPDLPCEVKARLETWQSDPAHPERPPTRSGRAWAGSATVERIDPAPVIPLRELANDER